MRVEMRFDDEAIKENGYSKKKVYATIKKGFRQRDIPCSFEGELLSFEDCGRKDDYAHIWQVLLTLLQADWFNKTLSRHEKEVFWHQKSPNKTRICPEKRNLALNR